MPDANKEKLPMPEKVIMPTELVNEILGVFNNMPYGQVSKIINKIQTWSEPVVEDEK